MWGFSYQVTEVVYYSKLYFGVLLTLFYFYLSRFDYCTLVLHKQRVWFYGCCLAPGSAKHSWSVP